MPTLDLRPAKLNGSFRPGDPFSIVLTGPDGWLTSRSFTATFGGQNLTVSEDDNDLVISASGGITGDYPSRAVTLTVSDGANVWITGSWTARTDGSTSSRTEVSVTYGPAAVALTVVGAFGSGSAAVDSVNGRTGDVTGLAEASDLTALDGRVDALEAADPLTQADADDRYWPLTTDLATQDALDTEATARAAADSALDGRLDVIEAISIATDAELANEAALARNADNLTSGTVDDARIPAAIARDAEVTSAITAAVDGLKNGAPAGGDTLAELDARIAAVEALGSLATDAELVAAVAALIGTADTAGDTLGELEALIGLRLLKSQNLADLPNAGTARTNLGLGTAAVVDTGTGDANVPTNAQIDTRHSLGVKAPVRLASTANLSGLFLTTTAQEIGNGALTVDGVAAAAGDVILLKNQSTAAQNGLWVVTSAGSGGTPWTLTRLATADAAGELVAGTRVNVYAGATLAGTSWYLTTTGTITPGTTGQTWAAVTSRTSGLAPIQTRKSDGDIAINTTTSAWKEIDTSGSAAARNLDVVIPNVQAGDWVTYNPSFFSLSAAVAIFCDVWTIVGGVAVNQFGVGTGGVSGWFLPNGSNAVVGPPASKQLVSGDIENGSVRLRFMTYRLAATARSIAATGGNSATFEGRGPFV